MNPFFSIIVPCCDVAPYLRECLDSLLAQTFTDWEAICVDDGSTDGSGAILDEYAAKDSRFRVFHQPNAGVSAARNKALDVAQGEWIWFVDGDDAIEIDAMEQFSGIEEKADITFFSMRLLQDDGFANIYVLKKHDCTCLDDQTSFSLLELANNSLHIDAFGWTCNKIIRRDMLVENAVRFPEHISYFEDELFTLEIFRFVRTFAVTGKVFYNYRILGTSLTRSRNWLLRDVGNAFMGMVDRSKWEGLRRLSWQRAYGFLRKAILQKDGIVAAGDFLELAASHRDMMDRKGKFNRLALFLAQFVPTSMGALILWAALRLWR